MSMIHGDIQAHFSVLDVSVDNKLDKKLPVKESQLTNPITVSNVLDNLQLMSRVHPEDHGVNVKQLANRLRALNRQWSVDQYEAEDETTRILKLAEAHELCHEISKNFWRPGSRPKCPPIVQQPAPKQIPQERTPERHFLLHEQERKIHVVEKPAHKSGRRKLLQFLKTLLRIASSSPDSSKVDEIKPAGVQERESVAPKVQPQLIHYREMDTTRARSRKIVGFREPTTIIPTPKMRQENLSNFTLVENITTIREQKCPIEYTGKPGRAANDYRPEFLTKKFSQKEENRRHKSSRERRHKITLQRRTITDLLDDSDFGESRKRDKWIRSERSSRTVKNRSHRYNRSRSDQRCDKSRSWRKTQRERSRSRRHTEDEEEMSKHRSSRRKLESRKQSKRKYRSHRKQKTRENSGDDDNDGERNGRRSDETAGEQKAEQSSLYWQMKALAPLSSTDPQAAAPESSHDDVGGHRKKSKRQSARLKKKPLCKPCRREMRRSVKWNLVQVLCNLLNKEEKRTGRKHCLCEKCLGVKGGQSKDCRFAKRVDVEDEDKAHCARHSTTLSRYLTTK